jgi:hypothetical protein
MSRTWHTEVVRSSLDEVIAELRRRSVPVPRPRPLPTEADVAAAESSLGLFLHHDVRRYLLEASDVVVGTIEPVSLAAGHTDLRRVLHDARVMGVPNDLVPICEDNGDYYCMTPLGEVVFWSHNGRTDERWPDLASWIVQVWIAGA